MSTATTPAPEPTEAQQELVRRIRREGLSYRTFDEAAQLIAASERAAVHSAVSKREFLSMDHPAANGRKPLVGDAEYPMRIPLDDGTNLTLRLGQAGFSEVTNLLMDMLSNAPAHDDGSLLPDSPMSLPRKECDDLRAQLAAATARAETAEKEIARLLTAMSDRSKKYSKSLDDWAQDADKRIEAMDRELTAAREDARRWQRVAGERFERLSLIGREMSMYMRDFWPFHREAVAALKSTPQSYIIKPKCLEAIEQICRTSLAATASEQPTEPGPTNPMLQASAVCAQAALDPLNRGEIAGILSDAARILSNTCTRASVAREQPAQYSGHAAHVKQADKEADESADLRSCMICGLTVDITKGHVAPDPTFTQAGRQKGLKPDEDDTNRIGGAHNPEGPILCEQPAQVHPDSARLDWLDQQPRAAIEDVYRHSSIRDGIDAARAAQAAQPEARK